MRSRSRPRKHPSKSPSNGNYQFEHQLVGAAALLRWKDSVHSEPKHVRVDSSYRLRRGGTVDVFRRTGSLGKWRANDRELAVVARQINVSH